jgi:hypothetical protein
MFGGMRDEPPVLWVLAVVRDIDYAARLDGPHNTIGDVAGWPSIVSLVQTGCEL